ncbi:MAG: ATP-binding protein, partial [Bacteroidota bacterium]
KLQRLSAQPTGGEHSTGLGLYIVKQLVEAHGGEVGVDSEAGKGATFWLRVPLPPPHPFAEPPAAQAGSFSA